MDSGARLPVGLDAEAEAVSMLGMCSLSAESSYFMGPSWRHLSEPRGRGCTPRAPAPCHVALSGSSLNTFPKTRRPHRPCLPQGLLSLLTLGPKHPPTTPHPWGGALFRFSLAPASSSPLYEKSSLLPPCSSLRAQLNPAEPSWTPRHLVSGPLLPSKII